MLPNQGVMLEWKEEPASPNGGDLSYFIDEDWLIFNDDIDVPDIEISDPPAETLTKAQRAAKLLQELEVDDFIKEEPLQDWLEEKINIPIFEDLGPESTNPALNCDTIAPSQCKPQLIQHPSPSIFHHSQQLPSPVPQVDQTQSLLQEFESVFGDVGAGYQVANSGATLTLTPPQSPPPANPILVSLQPINRVPQHVQLLQQQQYPQQQDEIVTYVYAQNQQRRQPPQQQLIDLLTPQQGNFSNYQVGPEIISPELTGLEGQWSAENLSVAPLLLPGSPQESEVSVDVQKEIDDVDEFVRSCAEDAAPFSPFTSSSETGSYEDSSEDPDWIVDTRVKTSQPRSSSLSHSRAGRKPRPYARPSPEDKRVRKKEQNKNAATRYRMKKKQEIKDILTEEQELVQHNEDLTAKVHDLQREIGYLKNLMRDLCKAKGLIK